MCTFFWLWLSLEFVHGNLNIGRRVSPWGNIFSEHVRVSLIHKLSARIEISSKIDVGPKKAHPCARVKVFRNSAVVSSPCCIRVNCCVLVSVLNFDMACNWSVAVSAVSRVSV